MAAAATKGMARTQRGWTRMVRFTCRPSLRGRGRRGRSGPRPRASIGGRLGPRLPTATSERQLGARGQVAFDLQALGPRERAVDVGGELLEGMRHDCPSDVPAPPMGSPSRRWPRRAGLDAQHLGERDPSSVHPGLHGAHRHVEDLRDVVVGHVLHVGEHQRDAVVLGDLGQAPGPPPSCPRSRRRGRRSAGPMSALRSVVGIDRPQHGPSLLAPQRVVAGVHADAVEPGAEGRLAAELVELAHRDQEGVLRGVMGVLGVAHDPQAQPVDVRPDAVRPACRTRLGPRRRRAGRAPRRGPVRSRVGRYTADSPAVSVWVMFA